MIRSFSYPNSPAGPFAPRQSAPPLLGLLVLLVASLVVGCSIHPTRTATLDPGPALESGGSPAEDLRRGEERAEYLGPSIPPGSEIGPSRRIPSATYTGLWENLGPDNFAGKVYDLSTSATDPDVVAAAYGPGGLWMTRDGGLQWERLADSSLRNRFASVHLWAGDHDVIFAGMGFPGLSLPAEQGVIRSVDGGATWTPIGPGLEGAEAIYRIVASPSDAGRIWVASTHGVYRTVDAGVTWEKTLSFPGAGDFWQYLPDLALHPHDPSVLWAAHRSIDVMKSVDGGQTWQSSASGFPAITGAVVITVHASSASDPGTLYAVEDVEGNGNGTSWLKSDDGGASWSLLEQNSDFDQGRYDMSIAVDPSDPNHVLIGNTDAYRSTDGQNFEWMEGNETILDAGANEGEMTSPAPHVDHLRFAFSPANPDVVWSGNDGGVYRSVDGGLNWWKTDRGVTSNLAFWLGVDQNSDALYLTSNDWNRTLHYRGGQDWWQFNGYEQQFFAVDPVDSDILYTAFDSRVRRSTDRGVNWTDIDPEPGGLAPPDRPFRFDPRNPEIVYSTTTRVYRSPDRGATWQPISPSLGGLEGIVDLAISDKDPAVIVAITDVLVWMSTDGGANWNTVGVPLVSANSVAFVPGSADSFTVVTGSDVIRSSAGGATWTSIRSNLPTTTVYDALLVDPTRPDRLVLGTADGVYVTDDDGAQWSSLGVGLPPVEVRNLGLREGFVYAATEQGVWRYDLSRADAFIYNDFVETTGLVFPPTVSPQLQQAVATQGMLLLPDDSQPGNHELEVSSGVWTQSAPLLREGFEARFRFRIRNGADDGAGLAFVIQNESDEAYGTELGYAGIETSLAIEIDPLADDLPEGPHVSIQSNGAAANSASIASSLAYTVLAPNDLAPNRTHEVRIDYRPGWVEVFLDDLERAILIHELDLSQVRGDDLLDASGHAWVGLTGQKAAFVDGRYEILSFSLRPANRRFYALPGARSHWRMDDAVGVTVNDSSGNDHHGSSEGGPQWSYGRVGGGLVLDGADDLVRFGTEPALSGTTDFTLSAWVKTTGSEKMTILQQRDETGFDGEYYLFLQPGTGVPVFGVYGDGTLQFEIVGSVPVNDGRWHHIAAGRASTDGHLWVDGEPDGVVVGSLTAPLDPTIQVFLGFDDRDGHGFFDGVIDDVRIYDVLLSEDQIGQIGHSRPLAVELAGNGSGTVTSEPAAIDCGTVCMADLPIGWSTRLVAVADEGSGFAGWSGACRGGDAEACTTYDWSQNEPATATFVLIEEPGAPSGHWKFDEGSGSVAEDSSGNDHPGTIVGADWVPGIGDGTALDFDGIDDVVTFGTGPSLTGTTDFTVSAWVRSLGMVGEGVVIQQRNGDFDGQYQLRVGLHGRPVFLVFGGGALQFEFPAQESVTDGTWHHVAAVREGDEGRIYVNGGLSGSALGPVQPLSPIISVAVGADIRDDDEHFFGQIDDVRIYDSALTHAQILGLATPPEPVVIAPGIHIDKTTNGFDMTAGTGPLIPVGNAVTWRYVVFNSGNVDLNPVTVVDDQLGDITASCDQTSLAVGESMLCTVSEPAVAGPYVNNVTATGTPPMGPVVVGTDTSRYFGGDPGINIECLTNQHDADVAQGPTIPEGDGVAWTYVVENVGNEDLTSVTVADDMLGAVSCPQDTLAVGETMTCVAQGTAVAGQYQNTATATGTPPVGPNVTDSDPSHYFGGSPDLRFEKRTNGFAADTAPGPQIVEGDPVTWTFLVENTGNEVLTIEVSDDEIGVVDCPQPTLAPGASMVCTEQGIATIGPYENTGTVTATPPVGPPLMVSDKSHYFGSHPGIVLQTSTNGEDADTAPGPRIEVGDPVVWTYVITNTGNSTLTGIELTDSDLGVIGTCPSTTLDAGNAMTCTAAGTARPGQYESIATTTAQPPAGPSIVARDPSHYFGVEPGIDIEKSTNGVDADHPTGPQIPVGAPVTWDYVVTSTGSEFLTDILVTDDKIGEICRIPLLPAGSNTTCQAFTNAAFPGQYDNTATVIGTTEGGRTIQDRDKSHYFGAQSTQQIFADGFETGDTSRWSNQTP